MFESAGYQNYADKVKDTARQKCFEGTVDSSDDDICVEISPTIPLSQPPIFPINESCSVLPPTTNAMVIEEADSSGM